MSFTLNIASWQLSPQGNITLDMDQNFGMENDLNTLSNIEFKYIAYF